MRILVACEESQAVTIAFRKKGHEAFSCDLEPCSGGHPEWHLHGDVNRWLYQDWEMIIAHPPCTYLSNSGVKHLYSGGKKSGGRNEERWKLMREAADFFNQFLNHPCPKRVIENPVQHGHATDLIHFPWSQSIQPWQFGHREMKATLLWVFGLPLLQSTNVVGPPPTDPVERLKWAVVHRCPPGADRAKIRSKTYSGIAAAMAEQWG